jgi:hypothetical protein
MIRTFAALTTLAVLPSCAGAPPTSTADNGRTWEHRCPAAGTVVRASTGGVVTYRRQTGPGECRRSDGSTAFYGFWIVPAGQEPPPELRSWLAGLFPASVGRSGTGSYVGRSNQGSDTYMWTREARIAGFEILDLPAGRFDTVLVEWDDRGMAGNTFRGRHRRWLDMRTGALVRSEARVLMGNGQEHAWQAVSISTPAAASR